MVGLKVFAAVAGPFDRPADPPRRPGDDREFRVEAAARPEIAADIVHDHARLFGRHAQHHREVAPRADRAAGAGVERVAAGRRVELADRGARLHRHPGDALHPGVEADDMRGAGEGRVGRGGVADLAVEDDVGAVPPRPRRAGLGGGRAQCVTAGSTS